MPDEYHKQVREAVVDAVETALTAATLSIDVVEQDKLTPNVLDLPVIVASYDAGAESLVGGTNASDYIAFPVLLSYLSNRPDLGVDPTGARTTLVRETIRKKFNQKRLSGLTDVYLCQYQSAGPVLDELPIEQLRAQMVITVYARQGR